MESLLPLGLLASGTTSNIQLSAGHCISPVVADDFVGLLQTATASPALSDEATSAMQLGNRPQPVTPAMPLPAHVTLPGIVAILPLMGKTCVGDDTPPVCDAAPAQQLRNDPPPAAVIQAALAFSRPHPPQEEPMWEELWTGEETTGEAEQAEEQPAETHTAPVVVIPPQFPPIRGMEFPEVAPRQHTALPALPDVQHGVPNIQIADTISRPPKQISQQPSPSLSLPILGDTADTTAIFNTTDHSNKEQAQGDLGVHRQLTEQQSVAPMPEQIPEIGKQTGECTQTTPRDNQSPLHTIRLDNDATGILVQQDQTVLPVPHKMDSPAITSPQAVQQGVEVSPPVQATVLSHIMFTQPIRSAGFPAGVLPHDAPTQTQAEDAIDTLLADNDTGNSSKTKTARMPFFTADLSQPLELPILKETVRPTQETQLSTAPKLPSDIPVQAPAQEAGDSGQPAPDALPSEHEVAPAFPSSMQAAMTESMPDEIAKPEFVPATRVIDQITRQLASQHHDVQQAISLRLDPPSLGEVQVHLITRADGEVTARIEVANAQTFHLLDGQANELSRSLQAAGVKVEQCTVALQTTAGFLAGGQAFGQPTWSGRQPNGTRWAAAANRESHHEQPDSGHAVIDRRDSNSRLDHFA